MPDKTCKTCGGSTNTAVCDYAEHSDLEPRRCYLRWEEGNWVPGCGYDDLLPNGLERRFADSILGDVDTGGLQVYAINCSGGWSVLEAHIPCEAGQGKVLASGLSYEKMCEVMDAMNIRDIPDEEL